MPSAHRTFAHVVTDVPEARRFLGRHLGLWGLESVRHGLELALSELVTNAVTHGRGAVDVGVCWADGTVVVTVTDRGGGRPAIRPAVKTGDDVGGWGLRLVEQIADGWGTEVAGGRTTVWLRVDVPSSAPGHRFVA